MAIVKLDDSVLHNIADKIREKNRETNTYYPSEMPDAIGRILVTEPVVEQLDITANGTYTAPEGVHGYSPINVDVPPNVTSIDITANGTYTAEGVDGYNVINVNTPPGLTDEDLTITGDCSNRFYGDGWTWFIDKYGDRITTKDITSAESMFEKSTLEEIPFQINISSPDCRTMFRYATQLRVCPKIRGNITTSNANSTIFQSMINDCNNLRDLEDLFTTDMLDFIQTLEVTSAYSSFLPPVFNSCYSLRTIPSWWYKFKLNEESTSYPNYSNSLYYWGFSSCYALDEITNIPVWKCQAAQTRNMFYDTFSACLRVKNATFETNDDGTSIETQWTSQTITTPSGYGSSLSTFTAYNSGITADKEVTDDTTYQALKDDPDWFTCNIAYSRYNHDSAVATINSLPDTSAYLATAGGTNTIKFKSASGSLTDGGAINTLTEEEIAVAAAKGWTVSLV